MSTETELAATPVRDTKRSRWIVAQLVLTLAAFAYLLSTTDTAALLSELRRAPLWCVPAAVATLLLVMLAGALRWRFLLVAYGAARPPRLARLFRLQLVGLFYNLLPGAVGGDVVRGLVSRDAFGEGGVSAGLAVVLVERVFGLVALMLLVATVLVLHPIPGLRIEPAIFGVGILGSAGVLAGIAAARRIAPFFPAVLGRLAASLPTLSKRGAFGAALAVSVINQMLVGVMGHLTIVQLAPQVRLLDSLALSPLAFAAIFFPLTVAGAGTRDAAMVALYGILGVPAASVLSASLQILLAYVIVGAIGGCIAVLTRLDASAHGERRGER